jgi:DNA polymerase-3 subunit epsilon
MANFVAIDFETADYGPDSACAVGLVRVESGKIVERRYQLLKPPRRDFHFTYIHGISWAMVARQPAFAKVWPELRTLLNDAEFIAAHNAGFDRNVLYACCDAAELERPEHPFVCTVRLARRSWGIRPTNLSNVCRVLSIPLQHHFALSDAEACAKIVLEAESCEEALQR